MSLLNYSNYIGKDTGKTMRWDKMCTRGTSLQQPKLSCVRSKSFDRGFASLKRDTHFAFQSFRISHPEELVRAKQSGRPRVKLGHVMPMLIHAVCQQDPKVWPLLCQYTQVQSCLARPRLSTWSFWSWKGFLRSCHRNLCSGIQHATVSYI